MHVLNNMSYKHAKFLMQNTIHFELDKKDKIKILKQYTVHYNQNTECFLCLGPFVLETLHTHARHEYIYFQKVRFLNELTSFSTILLF